MAVSYNSNLGVWQVNGRGGYASQAEAAAADGGGAAPAAGGNDTGSFTTSAQQAAAPGYPTAPPRAPLHQPGTAGAAATPRAATPSGYVGGGRTASGGATFDPAAQAATVAAGNQGATAGYAAGNQATKDAYRDMHDPSGFSMANLYAREIRSGGTPGQGVTRGPGAEPLGSGSARGLPASTAEAGIAPPKPAPTPGQAPPPSTGIPTNYQVDRTAYDQAAQGLEQARNDFYGQLAQLSGVDPFGNQAFLQKATDRAVSQAAGTAAGARGGAAAQAGAQRQAVGVQAQTAARGTQEVAEQGRRDAVQASQLRLQTVGGIAEVAGQQAANEQKFVDQTAQAAELNLRAQLGGRELDQAERNSLRNVATEVAKIDMQRYQTDVGYRENVNNNLTAMYQSDNALKGLKMQVDAGENMSADEWMMGWVGMVGGAMGGAAMSDRRVKKAITPAKTSELREYLAASPGSHYRYRDPKHPGQRAGQNFGPMAQDLQKSKIGRTLVVEGKGGLYVDTGRLALADHGALVALAQRVERLAAKVGKKA